jgi:hypothetical protein
MRSHLSASSRGTTSLPWKAHGLAGLFRERVVSAMVGILGTKADLLHSESKRRREHRRQSPKGGVFE